MNCKNCGAEITTNLPVYEGDSIYELVFCEYCQSSEKIYKQKPSVFGMYRGEMVYHDQADLVDKILTELETGHGI